MPSLLRQLVPAQNRWSGRKKQKKKTPQKNKPVSPTRAYLGDQVRGKGKTYECESFAAFSRINKRKGKDQKKERKGVVLTHQHHQHWLMLDARWWLFSLVLPSLFSSSTQPHKPSFRLSWDDLHITRSGFGKLTHSSPPLPCVVSQWANFSTDNPNPNSVVVLVLVLLDRWAEGRGKGWLIFFF